MDTLLRHWHMLRRIPRHPRKVSTAEIEDSLAAAGFPTTRRTIQRDLDKLSREFPLLSDGNKPSGWSWQADADLFDVPGMETTEALTFRMIEMFLSRMLPKGCLASLAPHTKRAHQILQDLEGEGMKSWPEKVRTVQRTQPLIMPEIPTGVLDVVYDALFHDRQFMGHYCNRTETVPKEYLVNPLGLVFADPVVYLVATLWEYDDLRLLALHRFKSADLLATPSRRSQGFSLDDYLAKSPLAFPIDNQSSTIRLVATFEADTARHIEECPLSTDQTITPDEDGYVTITATVADTLQLRWWLLGFGSCVTVHAPQHLREAIIDEVQEMIKLYRQQKV